MRRCTSAATAFLALVAALATAAPAGAVAGFGDVLPDQYYTDAVQWMVDNSITDGTSPGCFSPDSPTTRAQVATFIHRVHGEPAGASGGFDDVGAGDFYADAVAWMVDEGITTGTSPTTFSPDRLVTRAEVATFLHRAEGSPPGTDPGFDDVPPSAFYEEAVGWMVAAGVTTGTSPTTFEPDRHVTRGEVATFLYRVAGQPAVTLTAGAACPQGEAEIALVTAEAHSMALLGQLRQSLGIGTLTRDPAMDAFARDWSETMDRTGDFQHSSGPYGENIAWWSAGSASPEAAAQRLHDLWVDSPGHYANMTRASYTSVGVGFWQSSNGWHATHVFR